MYIKCIDNEYVESELTINKVYEVINVAPFGAFGNQYEVINDAGQNSYYWSSMFEKVRDGLK